MNYTTNYHLPQWVETDRILMEDFNQMCEDIDGGIAAAKAAADTAKTTAAAAQDAADAAQSAADAAQSTADNAYCPENKPYVTGTYTGTGSSISVTLGFRATMIIISGDLYNSTEENCGRYTAVYLPDSFTQIIVNDTGFSVYKTATYPNLNEKNHAYGYIAFR